MNPTDMTWKILLARARRLLTIGFNEMPQGMKERVIPVLYNCHQYYGSSTGTHHLFCLVLK